MPSAKVFISYAKDTKPAAQELTRALEQNGFHAWPALKDLQAGQRWQQEIERAADTAQQFLVLVGPHSTATPWLEAEWRTILAKAWSDSHKSVIPILFGGGDPPAEKEDQEIRRPRIIMNGWSWRAQGPRLPSLRFGLDWLHGVFPTCDAHSSVVCLSVVSRGSVRYS
jgi:hypothetical protein